MSHLFVETPSQLAELVEKIKRCQWVALDTEFISEGRFLPDLCLVQIAAEGILALIDAPAIGDMRPFWSVLADESGGNREVVVHAGRSELEFCYRSVQKFPPKVFDVQLAAGFIGLDYPAGFRSLLSKILNLEHSKEETRTDWLKRPLSRRQIEYALDDVRYLSEMTAVLKKRMLERSRLEWCYEEQRYSQQRLLEWIEEPQWRNTTKSGHLNSKELAILRELWLWRNSVAESANQPAQRVIRNDLIVELAKRKTADIKRIHEIRGMQRGHVPEISKAIEKALSLPPEEWPKVSAKANFPHYSVRVQFLYAALSLICEQKEIATALVGSPGDIRERIAESFGTLPEGIRPKLSHGWRAEIIGPLLDDLLEGRSAIRMRRDGPLELLPLAEHK